MNNISYQKENNSIEIECKKYMLVKGVEYKFKQKWMQKISIKDVEYKFKQKYFTIKNEFRIQHIKS